VILVSRYHNRYHAGRLSVQYLSAPIGSINIYIISVEPIRANGQASIVIGRRRLRPAWSHIYHNIARLAVNQIEQQMLTHSIGIETYLVVVVETIAILRELPSESFRNRALSVLGRSACIQLERSVVVWAMWCNLIILRVLHDLILALADGLANSLANALAEI
jgi:hypothetical protein